MPQSCRANPGEHPLRAGPTIGSTSLEMATIRCKNIITVAFLGCNPFDQAYAEKGYVARWLVNLLRTRQPGVIPKDARHVARSAHAIGPCTEQATISD